MISALSKRSPLLFLSLALILFSALPIPPASALTPAEVSLDALANQKFNGSELKLIKKVAGANKYSKYQISYLSEKLTISGVLYIPNGKGPFPGLVLGHGYIDPKIYKNGQGMKREQNYFAANGFIVLHTDYRNHAFGSKDKLSNIKFRMDYSIDVANAAMALKNSDLKSLDKSKISYVGRSMGGGIGFNLAVSTKDIFSSYVLYAPTSANYPQNFNKWGRDNPARLKPIKEFVGLPEDNPEFWKGVSPENYWDRATAPIMIHHGVEDKSCSISWARSAVKGLKSAQKEVVFFEYPGEGHNIYGGWNKSMSRTVNFLKVR
jgi:dipeptidyl aminopeptidase/acylaminoacyl peptidase